MIYEIEEFTQESFTNLLEEIKKKNKQPEKKTLAKHYGCLVRGLDGVEYQKAVRYGTDD